MSQNVSTRTGVSAIYCIVHAIVFFDKRTDARIIYAATIECRRPIVRLELYARPQCFGQRPTQHKASAIVAAENSALRLKISKVPNPCLANPYKRLSGKYLSRGSDRRGCLGRTHLHDTLGRAGFVEITR